MDGNRFDGLTKALAGPRSRRSVLGLLAAAAGGLLAGTGGAGAAPPPDKPTKCYGSGSHCTNAKQCCSGTCTNRRCAGDAGPPQCVAANCPGQDTECQKRVCNSGICGIDFAPYGAPISQQKPGDCLTEICDGAGGITFTYDGNDAPPSPSQCLVSFCGADGQPHLEPTQPGTPCNENGGVVCDGNGTCVAGGGQCVTGEDCAGQDTECQKRTCIFGSCGMDFAPAGSPTFEQIPGDCRLNVCDGVGNVTFKPFGEDAPVTDNECKVAFCGADNEPHIEPKMAGEPCSQNGGVVCNGEGACVASLVPQAINVSYGPTGDPNYCMVQVELVGFPASSVIPVIVDIDGFAYTPSMTTDGSGYAWGTPIGSYGQTFGPVVTVSAGGLSSTPSVISC